MIFILVLLIGVALTFRICISEKKGATSAWPYPGTWVDVAFYAFIGGFFTAIALLLVSLPSGFFVRYSTVDREAEVVSLADALGVRGSVGGSFFGFSGNVGSELVWSWYERDENGVMHGETASEGDGVNITEQPPSAQPRVIARTVTQEVDTPWWYLPFNVPLDTYTGTTDLYVPKGTVETGMKLDGGD